MARRSLGGVGVGVVGGPVEGGLEGLVLEEGGIEGSMMIGTMDILVELESGS